MDYKYLVGNESKEVEGVGIEMIFVHAHTSLLIYLKL